MATEHSLYLKEHDKLIQKTHITMQEAKKTCDAYPHPCMSWIKNANGDFLKTNKLFSDFFHFSSPEMIIGKSDFDLNHVRVGYTGYDFRFTDQCVMKGSSYNKKIELVILRGQAPSLLLVTKIPVLSDDGKAIAVFGVAQSLTPTQVQELNDIATLAPACTSTRTSLLTETEAQIQTMRKKLKLSAKEIATIRNTSKHTIDKHLYNIRVKLYRNTTRHGSLE
ncbi:MAG: hypothetical protein WC748_09415 [Legionellales bacterium]|jgi:DNA-binding CsgD family transcriptional regulator